MIDGVPIKTCSLGRVTLDLIEQGLFSLTIGQIGKFGQLVNYGPKIVELR